MLNITTVDSKIKELAKKPRDTYTQHENSVIRNTGQEQNNYTLQYSTPVILGNGKQSVKSHK